MRSACDIGKGNKLDALLRRYVLCTGAVCGFAGLLAGSWAGFRLVSNAAAAGAPYTDKVFLAVFIAVSGAAAGVILGAFVGSAVYRLKEKSRTPGS